MARLAGSDGRIYHTEAELARGGEGAIWTIQGWAEVVAKLYLPDRANAGREAKLRAMIRNPPRDEMQEQRRHAAIAWPVAVLRMDDRFAGFLMPRMYDARPLINAYNPRAKDALSFDWHDQYQVAANLCAAVSGLHSKGYVVGDLNPRNVLVTRQGLVTLVDTDSFQVRAHGSVHRCTVGTPEYTPRELQRKHFEQIDRTPVHDCFGLAVLVFQLLMGGRHPFVGALKDSNDSLPGKIDEWCIANGIFPWVDNLRVRRPPDARPLEDLDPPLRELFRRCFVSGHAEPALRPTALEWRNALLASQGRLTKCVAGTHWRYPGVRPCHACETAARTTRPALQPRPQPPRPTPPSPAFRWFGVGGNYLVALALTLLLAFHVWSPKDAVTGKHPASSTHQEAGVTVPTSAPLERRIEHSASKIKESRRRMEPIKPGIQYSIIRPCAYVGVWKSNQPVFVWAWKSSPLQCTYKTALYENGYFSAEPVTCKNTPDYSAYFTGHWGIAIENPMGVASRDLKGVVVENVMQWLPSGKGMAWPPGVDIVESRDSKSFVLLEKDGSRTTFSKIYSIRSDRCP